MKQIAFIAAVVLAALPSGNLWAAYVTSTAIPPAPLREFRGVWVATVNNIDWPSKPGLSTAQQQAELRAILDRSVQLKLNAIILQVRPACDALYASKLEPWSEYLTGRMGQAPKPFYDPLAFAIEEAHQRGLELHAWFNPFRARHSLAKSPVAANHISRTKPYLVKKYGSEQWLDPGEVDVQRHSQAVILDVVKRYNIDGIHLDDYFYPYPERDAKGGLLAFPDYSSRKRYLDSGGRLQRDSWRRQNVNNFIQKLYQAVKAAKPAVKVGISPFGIWRPGVPAQIKGFDAYALLYADAREWLQQGWLDYFAPQLYWAIGAQAQSFPVLLQWWAGQNVKHRELWPGISTYRHSPYELASQIRLTRKQSGADGNLLWSAKVLMENRNGFATRLEKEIYTQPALVPAFPWLDHQPPSRPQLAVTSETPGRVKLSWQSTGTEPAWLWLLQSKTDRAWTTSILTGREFSREIAGQAPPDLIALRAVDKCGNVGMAAVLQYRRR